MLIECEGDLLDLKIPSIKTISHQCNCRSKNAAGLAKVLFEKYPWANTYSKNEKRKLGTIDIITSPNETLTIINLYAQDYPGKPLSKKDYQKRLDAFWNCLMEISKYSTFSLGDIAFPHGIGCGLAGGNWNEYKHLIEIFANDYYSSDVYILKKGEE